MSNPNDIPGKVTIQFQTQQQCEQALNDSQYWLKFSSFNIKGECYESKEIVKKDFQSVRRAK